MAQIKILFLLSQSVTKPFIYTGEIKALGIMVTHCTYSESSYFSLFEDRYMFDQSQSQIIENMN